MKFGACDFSRFAVTDWRLRRWRLCFLALMIATRSDIGTSGVRQGSVQVTSANAIHKTKALIATLIFTPQTKTKCILECGLRSGPSQEREMQLSVTLTAA